MVLSACSPYFNALFLNHPEKHPIVILKDVPYADMKSLLDFMYRGEVSVDRSLQNRWLCYWYFLFFLYLYTYIIFYLFYRNNNNNNNKCKVDTTRHVLTVTSNNSV